MELQKSGHSVYRNQYHIVWIPKYRRRILNPGLRSYCTKVLKSELRSMPGVELKEQTLREDHVHIVLVIPPKYRVADVIGRLKAKTAGALRDKFDWLANVYWKENIVWSPGYFVTTFGIDESIVLDYVRHQADQDSGQASLDLS